MKQTCNCTSRRDNELIEVLSEISRVSARMARDLSILIAQRKNKKGSRLNGQNE